MKLRELKEISLIHLLYELKEISLIRLLLYDRDRSTTNEGALKTNLGLLVPSSHAFHTYQSKKSKEC